MSWICCQQAAQLQRHSKRVIKQVGQLNPCVRCSTIKVAFGQHDVNNFGVQVREHLLHAPDSVFSGGARLRRAAAWKVARRGRLLVSRVGAQTAQFWRPAGHSGRALAALLPPRHSAG